MKRETFEGRISKDDALEIKNRMQQEARNGNRFVAFSRNDPHLTQRDFAGFISALAALEYAHEKSTPQDKYLVRSVWAVEKVMERILENRPEKTLPDGAAKNNKRSKDEALLR